MEVSLKTIKEAFTRMKNDYQPTPLVESERFSQIIGNGNKIFFKEEHKHITGSYKERGAFNKIMSLSDEEKARGVVTNSAGNHGQAVAYIAHKLGIKATIVMPKQTPHVKVQGCEKYGANVIVQGNGFDEAFEIACGLCREKNLTFVHAFNDPYIISGQGTLGLEILHQNPYIDTIISPIGGGGLIAGTSLAIKSINPTIHVYGVETKKMPKMSASIKSGGIQKIPYHESIADGITVKSTGKITYDIVKKYVDDFCVVDEEEISFALLKLLEEEKTLVEGAGATALAALLSEKLKFENKNIAVILSGGNIDTTLLRNIVETGLVVDGRLIRLRVESKDVPYQMGRLGYLLGDLGCNVHDAHWSRGFDDVPLGYTAIWLTVSIKGPQVIPQITKALDEADFIKSWNIATHKNNISQDDAKLNFLKYKS